MFLFFIFYFSRDPFYVTMGVWEGVVGEDVLASQQSAMLVDWHSTSRILILHKCTHIVLN